MGQDTEELKKDIENTRADMSGTLDAIGDRVMPGRIAQRNKNRVVQSVQSLRDRVMGTASEAHDKMGEAKDGAAGAISDAVDTVKHAPETVTNKAQGAPMVAGALAFGIGFLAAAAFPASQKEKELSSQVIDAIEPAKEQLVESAREVAENLKQPALDAADSVKAAASDSVHEVADTAKVAAQSTKDQASDSVETVKSSAPTS